MSFLPASRTKRNLFKIASLGLAGLLAGLLAGCSETPETTVNVPHTPTSTGPATVDASLETKPSFRLPKSIEATQIPALRHPPSSRSLQYGSARTVSMAMVPNGRNGS
jgi:hypothetical protein